MKIKALLCFVVFSMTAFTKADEQLDLKSVLLQILNKVKATSETDTVNEINLDSSADTTPTGLNKGIMEGASDNNEPSDEYSSFESYKNEIMKYAIEEINAEIVSLETKYDIELKTNQNPVDLPWNKSPEKEDDGQDKENDYDVLVGEMKKAANRLHLLRLKIATDFEIHENENEVNEDKPNKVSKPKDEVNQQDQSSAFRLMKILAAIEKQKENQAEADFADKEDMLTLIVNALMQQNDHIEDGDIASLLRKEDLQKQKLDGESVAADLKERDWHTKNCAQLGKECLGWYPKCCDRHKFKGSLKFHMCCSVSNAKTHVKGSGAGTCVPNAFGRHSCDY